MSDDAIDIPFDDFDELHSPRPQHTDFDQVVDKALSRREFIGGILTLGTGAFLMSTSPM